MAISTGRLARVFAAKEAAYATPAALAAGDYIESTECVVANDPFNFEASPEKTPGQDVYESFQRRPTTTVRLAALLRGAPGGTTKPEFDEVLAAAMGLDAITVSAAAAVTGNANAGRVLFTADAADGYLRPHVGGSPTPLVTLAGAAVYGSINYPLGDDLQSLTLRYQPPAGGAGAGTGPGAAGAPSQLVTGWSPATLTLAVDGTSETVMTFEGPAARTQEGAAAGSNITGAPAHPALRPPVGLNAKAWFRVGSTGAFSELPHPFRTLTVTMTLPKMLRNDEAGSAYARGFYIGGQRETMVEISTYAETGNALYEAIRTGKAATPSEAPYVGLAVAIGNRQGQRAGLYLPRVRFTLPSGADGAEGIAWTLSGRAHAPTWADGNGSLALGVG